MRLAFVAAALAPAAGASAQAPEPAAAPGAEERVRAVDRDVPAVRLVRTETPPVIDGVLDEAAWDRAALIDDLRQVEPFEGADPSEHTEVRILYDENALYFGVRCFDREPEGIIATQLRRDGSPEPDDRLELVVDPFFDRRNGFFFAINPVGARFDALVQENSSLIEDWDGIWYGKATIDEGGWSAEIAIPFKTISFDPRQSRWGFNIQRTIRRNNETSRWSSPLQNKLLRSIADAGILEEIRDITQGIGLDVKPYGKAVARDTDDGDDDLDLDAGLDVFYKLTPSMTLTLTVNTDFAETEVDERRVNLTRFPLFFPEKRDFFLQDAGIFEFGGIFRNPLPFFSRRIGLDASGEPVDIQAGAKLTGRTGPLNLGALAVYTDAADTVEEKFLAVVRPSLNVLEESTVGLITTVGDPLTTEDNELVGADFNYRNSTVFGNRVLEGHAWFQYSWSTGSDQNDRAWGGQLRYPNDRFSWRVGFTEIGDEFNAALGFVPRRGIREYFGNWRGRLRPQSGWLRTVDSGIRSTLITDLNDRTETMELELELIELTSNLGDSLGFELKADREVLFEPFEIRPGLVIPIGDYRFQRFRGELETADARPVSFTAALEAGEFFDGDRVDTELGVEWRPSPNFFLGFSWEQNDVDLPGGDFEVQIAQARVNFLLSPDVSWTNFIQWDNVSDSLGINSRFRWIIEPGNELFVVLNQSFDTTDDRFDSTFTELTTKLGWTFRF
ncbi:MAG: carbohydrate binding family 9 domain-containing protein [Planctomycetota bacterium]